MSNEQHPRPWRTVGMWDDIHDANGKFVLRTFGTGTTIEERKRITRMILDAINGDGPKDADTEKMRAEIRRLRDVIKSALQETTYVPPREAKSALYKRVVSSNQLLSIGLQYGQEYE